jgi:hypothetical protein
LRALALLRTFPFAQNLGAYGVVMYRIELSPGDETVFRSIEELAVAIKRGVVSPRARIFHNASSKWLPIQFHPHYKAAVSMPLSQAELVAGPQAKPLSSLSLELPPEPEPEMERPVAPAPQATAPAETPAPKAKKTRSKPLARESKSRRRSKPRRQLRVALVGALLLGGAQWVLSVPMFSRATPPLLVDLQRQLIEAQTAAMKRVGSANTAGVIPVLPSAASGTTPEVLRTAPEPHGRVTAPSFGGSSSAETVTRPELEGAVAELPVATLPADSVSVRVADSTNQSTLEGILKTVSGGETPPAVKAPPRR